MRHALLLRFKEPHAGGCGWNQMFSVLLPLDKPHNSSRTEASDASCLIVLLLGELSPTVSTNDEAINVFYE